MKKFMLLALAVVLALPMAAKQNNDDTTQAKDSKIELPGFEWSIGLDAVSGYHWRGINYGGLSFQPDLALGYGGLTAEAWLNLGAQDYHNIKENWKDWDGYWKKELDVTLKYRICGFTVGVTQFFYFDGQFFNFKGEEDKGSSQTEVFAEFNLEELNEKFPLHLGWYTFVLGNDFRTQVDQDGNVKVDENGESLYERAYSTYIEASYTIALPLGFSITPTVGLTPWRSCYNFYEDFNKKSPINNISLRANWELTLGKHFALDVYAQAMMNTCGITKDNFWPAAQECYENQRFNFCFGAGIWLGN